MSDEQLVTPLERAIDREAAAEDMDNVLDSPEPVVVYTAGTQMDGEIVRSLLESEGIRAILTSASSPILGQIFGNAEGQAGEILVAPSDASRAYALISQHSTQ